MKNKTNHLNNLKTQNDPIHNYIAIVLYYNGIMRIQTKHCEHYDRLSSYDKHILHYESSYLMLKEYICLMIDQFISFTNIFHP